MNIRCFNEQAEISHLFYLFIYKVENKYDCTNKTHLKTSLNLLWNTTYLEKQIGKLDTNYEQDLRSVFLQCHILQQLKMYYSGI